MVEPSVETIQKLNFDQIERMKINFSKDSKDRYSLQYFEIRAEKLATVWKTCEELHAKVYNIKMHNESLVKDYMTEYSKMEELTLTLTTTFQRAIDQYKAQQPSDTKALQVSKTAATEDVVRLERVKIPTFEGDYLKWVNFYEMFKTLVHENKQLQDIQRMQYLVTSTKGEARRLIENLGVTGSNYQNAWKMLFERYNNKRTLLASHLQAFLSIPNVKSETAQNYKKLLDITNETLIGIKALNIDTKSWDPFIVYMASQKLDMETRKEWELLWGAKTDLPSWEDLAEFLSKKFRSLEAISGDVTRKFHNTSLFIQSEAKCKLCKGNHFIVKCIRFQQANVQTRREIVKNNNLCFNCLGNHRICDCKSKTTCRICSKKHNSMLHLNIKQSDAKDNNENSTKSFNSQGNNSTWDILLATAIIHVKNVYGEYIKLRALIDQGSQNSFITENCVQLLGLKREPANVTIKGLGNATNRSAGQISLNIREKWSNKVIYTTALILGRITQSLPSTSINFNVNVNIKNTELADPEFRTRSKIDVLLGADVYGEILLEGLKKGMPTAQKTKLGWILSGPIARSASTTSTSMISTSELDQQLSKFWEQEEIEKKPFLSQEQEMAEKQYITNVQRMKDGRYQVKMPWKDDPRTKLGLSEKSAIARYVSNEKRLLKNPSLFAEYNKCIEEYLTLGHMEEIPSNEVNKPCYYLPHHAVIKEESTTTKVRVVFNASAKSSSGMSLNDCLMVGPTIQDTLTTLILRWRTYPVVITADIEKMYRQISVETTDSDFQRILWRPNKTDIIRKYRLKTLTFGTANAPFQAIRTLRQLAEDETKTYPSAADHLKTSFYVDDLLTGVDTIAEAKVLYLELSQLLDKGGFNLRKWNSNHQEVLNAIPENHRGKGYEFNAEEDVTKTLGLQWLPRDDQFIFKADGCENNQQGVTKRTIASFMARLFDPLGWLQPIVIRNKIFMQRLWLSNLTWDQELPTDLKHEWMGYAMELKDVHQIKLPRWIGTTSKDIYELHGFCDASQFAMAAVVYMVIRTPGRTPIATLLSSKTKVAPIAVQTIPRLELTSAVLLVKLMEQIKSALRTPDSSRIYYWTDSTVVISWLNDHPSRWNTYVANRVSQIHESSTCTQWYHISTHENPADCATRGLSPQALKNHSLWWSGPQIILRQSKEYTKQPRMMSTDLERKIRVHLVTKDENILDRFSNFSKLIRVLAYCKRMLPNHECRKENTPNYLTTDELHKAKIICIKKSQERSFPHEIQALLAGKAIDKKSKVLQLCPYLDTDKILRVGGRLQKADLSQAEKHPIILSNECSLSKLIVSHFHHKTLHGSQLLTLNTMRKEFWILNANKLVTTCIHKCITCFKLNAKVNQQQLMGNLPTHRVTVNRPFWKTGLDFAGPITIKWSSGRGTKTEKSYIAVFICLSTKAIHLELVSSLTSQACIAAIKRFVSRRGKCKAIYSDCGTNFIGASKELQRTFERMTYETQAWIVNDNITWHHIPPSSPHFGGLWEAGVKSTKRHLVKVLGERLLNIEEMYTVLAQIEACLNSRPLAPISNDVNDILPLTPGHFLIGNSMFAVPDEVPDNLKLLKRWQLTQRITNDFWNRWKEEYLTRLQERPKWLSTKKNLQPGQLVLVLKENTPQTKWPLARILDVHPGEDGLVRVVTIKMNGNITKRPVVKLCPLPIEEADEEVSKRALKRTNQSQEVEAESPRKRKTPKVVTSSLGIATWPALILSVMITCFAIIPNVQALVNNTQIDGGLYIEKLGRSFLSRGTLKIEISIPTTEFLQDKQQVNATIKKMETLCTKGKYISEEIQCDTLNHHLQAISTSIIHRIESIQFLRSRTRRGVLGTILTSVFGVNEEVYHDIDNLSENQQTLRNTISHQGKVMLKAVKTLNDTNTRIEKRLRNFNTQLSQSIEKMNKFAAGWILAADHNGVQTKYLSTYQQAKNYLEEIADKYNCIWQIVSTRTSSWQCPHIIDLSSVLNKTEGHLPPTLKVYHRMTSQVIMSSTLERILIMEKLPIYEDKQYELIKATTVPTKIGESTYTVQTIPAEVLGIHYDSQTYFKFTEDMMANSIELPNLEYIVPIQAIYNIDSNPNCVISEIYQKFSRVSCSSKTIAIHAVIWKQLHQVNTWLYVSPNRIIAQAVCNGQLSEICLKDAGIIQLTSDCVVKTKDITITAEHQESTRTVQTYIKPSSIIPSNFSLLGSQQIQIPKLNISRVLQSSDTLTTLVEEASSLEEEIDNTIWKPIHRHAISSAISIILSVALIAMILLIWKHVQNQREQIKLPSKWYETSTTNELDKTCL